VWLVYHHGDIYIFIVGILVKTLLYSEICVNGDLCITAIIMRSQIFSHTNVAFERSPV